MYFDVTIRSVPFGIRIGSPDVVTPVRSTGSTCTGDGVARAGTTRADAAASSIGACRQAIRNVVMAGKER